jgi:hypothetical protein
MAASAAATGASLPQERLREHGEPRSGIDVAVAALALSAAVQVVGVAVHGVSLSRGIGGTNGAGFGRGGIEALNQA